MISFCDCCIGELLSSAVLIGCSKSTDINLINAKALSSAKVNVVTNSNECSCIQVGCEGGVHLTGMVLGPVPVLKAVNGMECGPTGLSGSIILLKGKSVKEVIQSVDGILQVRGQFNN